MDVTRLRDLDIEAWTYVLRSDPHMLDVTVEGVTAVPIRPRVTRYVLELAQHPEPITLLGVFTSATEARFYDELSSYSQQIAPRCYFAKASSQRGWVVLEETETDYQPNQWHLSDAESAIQYLARFHAAYWEFDFSGYGWLPAMATLDFDQENPAYIRPYGYSSTPFHRPLPLLNDQQVRNVGTLTPSIVQALAALHMLRNLGGWPGVISDEQLDAAETLLNHPERLLVHLDDLPQTLLHGKPTAYRWAMSYWNHPVLLDWNETAVGPNILDLVFMLEDLHWLYMRSPINWLDGEWPLIEETLLDSYFISLAHELENQNPAQRYSSRVIRRYALPAARCLYLLTHWLPRLSEWLMRLPASRHTWEMLDEMDIHQKNALGYTPLAELRPHLKVVFDQFLLAYKLL